MMALLIRARHSWFGLALPGLLAVASLASSCDRDGQDGQYW